MKTLLFYQQFYDLFNNFSANAVEYEGVLYPTAEHAYQAAKLTNQEAKDAVRSAKSPLLSKEISSTYKEFKRAGWDEVKLEIMEIICRAKLEQHEEVREALLKSGSDIIAEDSKEDSFWGIGADGQGQNHLGKIWMKLRGELNG